MSRLPQADANKREAGHGSICRRNYKALKEHPRAHALVPGKPELSELFLRISSADTSYKCPLLPATCLRTPDESELIRKWIVQVAKYEHWAL